MKEVKRNGFISFWLWLCTIANSVMAIIYFLLLFSSRGLFSSTPEPLWLRFTWLISTIVILVGFIMLLSWRKTGFYVLLASQVIGMVILLIETELFDSATTLTTIVSTIIGVLILYGVLQLKSDGVSYWDAMGNVKFIDYKE